VQSELVAARLRAAGVLVEMKTIVSDGDLRAPDTPIGEGIFVTALERALVAGEIDVAVHSAKDLPLEEDPQLVIAAYPERADARDALVTRLAARSLDDLAVGATVGTDSPRRAGFLRALRPDLNVIPLHGNVDTRLRRLMPATRTRWWWRLPGSTGWVLAVVSRLGWTRRRCRPPQRKAPSRCRRGATTMRSSS
jgi:hydroxymethylbilane synthase